MTWLEKKPMRALLRYLCLGATLGLLPPAYAESPLDQLLQEYHQSATREFSAASGSAFWKQAHPRPGAEQPRRCASCHTEDVRQPGKHVETGRLLEPLAPSVVHKRLTNPAKIRKWLKRNCQWVLGRECTAQEKGDVLTFLKSQ
jgi:hypothetical protein